MLRIGDTGGGITVDKSNRAERLVIFRATAAHLLASGEARRIAANIGKLPELLKRPRY
jgi:hypothetical protein